MIRVVLDTNIVVSAMLRSGGLPEAVFNLCIDRVIQPYASEPILAEYEEVLNRPRLDIDPKRVLHALARIREAAVLVNPAAAVTAALDPDDNVFLESPRRPELTGSMGDGIVVTPREFLAVFTETTPEPGDPPAANR